MQLFFEIFGLLLLLPRARRTLARAERRAQATTAARTRIAARMCPRPHAHVRCVYGHVCVVQHARGSRRSMSHGMAHIPPNEAGVFEHHGVRRHNSTRVDLT